MLQEQLEFSWALLTTLLGRILDGLVDAGGDGDGAVNNVGDADKVVLAEAAGCHGGGAHAKTAGDEGGTVARDGVLVGSNADELEDSLNAAAIDTVGLQISEDKVVVGAAADNAVSETAFALVVTEALGEGFSVGENLGLIGVEVGSLGLLEGHGESGDGVVVRTALVAGEDGGVDGTFEVVHFVNLGLGVRATDALAEEDESAAGTAQALVAGGGDDVGVGKRSGHDLGGYETRDVSHVGEHVGVDLVANLAHALVVDETAVGAGASDDDLGAVDERELLELIVVDQAGGLVQPVGDCLEVFGDEGDLLGGSLVAVGQMAAVRKVKTHEAIMSVHERGINVQVGGSTGES